MAKTSAYTLKNVSVTLDGMQVIGNGMWDGDDAVQIEHVEDVGSLMVGADGTSLFSQYSHNAARITLRLQHTSPIHRLLMQRLQRQRTQGVRLVGMPFSAIDIDSGEGGATDAAYIQTAPSDSKGKAAGVREWVLVTGNWKPEIPNG